MSDISAAVDEKEYTRNTIGRRKRRARRACLTCRSRKVRCDVMQKSPCSNCQWISCECVVIGPRRSPCKKNQRNDEDSKQPPNDGVPIEITHGSPSYNPYSPTLSHVEVKDEESSVLEKSYPPMDDILSLLTPVSHLEDEYCFGSQYASSHADQTSGIAWNYPSATSLLLSPASSGISEEQESDPIIWYRGEGIDDDLIGSLLALPFDNLRHI